MSSSESLEAQVLQLQALLAAALERIKQLEEENAQLRSRLEQNSTNSSKPPSSDPPGTVRPAPKPSRGRRPGGQPGHKKHERALVPPEQVQHFVDLVPKRCQSCQRRLSGKDTTPERHQVVELPPVAAVVTEYRCHQLECAGCGSATRAPLPPEVTSAFGERLAAVASVLVGKYRLSKRLVRDALSDLVGVELSVGSVINLEREMSAALAGPVTEAEAFVRQADGVHADETGWAQGVEGGRSARAWLWVVASTLVAVFRISTSRGSEVIKALLGEDFLGWLVTDRWSAYNWYDAGLRQVCWAHVTRDFQGFIDRGGEGARLGEQLMSQRDRMFRWWRRVRDGTLSREVFQRRMRKVERAVGRLLREAVVCAEQRTAGMAEEILKLEKCLWTFVDVPQLEPTNNFAERCIRPGVMYRKTSFGTRSPEGSRFVERVLTAVTTLKLQERPVLDYLKQALAAHRHGLQPPSLLPSFETAPAALAA